MQLPNPETLARNILRALIQGGCRPSEGLPLGAVRFTAGLDRDDDFAIGVNHAIERGWIEVKEDTGWTSLTKAGFDAA